MEGILRRISRRPYRSLIDGKDAYEQIRIEPEHVERTAMTTPDGNMVSLVLQQGDCNGPATYQALMNHIFAPMIGDCLSVYLDDITVGSDTVQEHIRDIRRVFGILRREELYISIDKMHLFAPRLDLLGNVVSDKEIQLDPHKVDCIENWKTPTNKDLVASFLGAVGYLAPDCAGIRIPMGILAPLTGSKKPWTWTRKRV